MTRAKQAWVPDPDLDSNKLNEVNQGLIHVSSFKSLFVIYHLTALPFQWQFVAGAVAGVSEILTMYPLDGKRKLWSGPFRDFFLTHHHMKEELK